MNNTTGITLDELFCPWCSKPDNYVIHGGACPKVKSIEYHPNGNLKRVEFNNGDEAFDDTNDFINTLDDTSRKGNSNGKTE